MHSISRARSKPCLVVILCSSSSRLTSCLSSRAWLYRWPLCRWAWASQLSPLSPPPLVSSPSPPCWPLKPSWPRRRKHLVTEWTATARRTERSPISRRSRSDTSDLSPHFAYSVSVTTDQLFLIGSTLTWWLSFGCFIYCSLTVSLLSFCLFYHAFFHFLFQPVFLFLSRSFFLSLHLISLCHLPTCSTQLLFSNLLSEKLKLKEGFEEAAKPVSRQNDKSVANKTPPLIASNFSWENIQI